MSPTRGEVLGDNWILGKSIPPPPRDPPPLPPGGQIIPPPRPLAGQAGPQPSGSPAISGSVHDQTGVESPRFAQASKAVPPGSRSAEVATEVPPRREVGDVVKETTTKYTDKVLSKVNPSSSDAEVKKVMKATKIQRDVVSCARYLVASPDRTSHHLGVGFIKFLLPLPLNTFRIYSITCLVI